MLELLQQLVLRLLQEYWDLSSRFHLRDYIEDNLCRLLIEFKNYRKLGAGKPCAGHKMEIIPLDLTNIGRVSSEESFGDVDEIGS